MGLGVFLRYLLRFPPHSPEPAAWAGRVRGAARQGGALPQLRPLLGPIACKGQDHGPLQPGLLSGNAAFFKVMLSAGTGVTRGAGLVPTSRIVWLLELLQLLRERSTDCVNMLIPFLKV